MLNWTGLEGVKLTDCFTSVELLEPTPARKNALGSMIGRIDRASAVGHRFDGSFRRRGARTIVLDASAGEAFEQTGKTPVDAPLDDL